MNCSLMQKLLLVLPNFFIDLKKLHIIPPEEERNLNIERTDSY